MKLQRHIVHLVYRFAAGGLENVIVQLVNGLPHDEFRHTVVALTSVDAAFVSRIARADVEVISLHKPPGQPFAMYPAVYRLLRRLRPDVLHTCNIAALEFMPVAWLARVPLRVHAEHGWDVADPDGSNRSYRRLRRLYRRFAHQFIAVSVQLHDYLRDAVGIPQGRLHFIPNGVDTERFRPRRSDDPVPDGLPFDSSHQLIASVGRLEPIKNHRLLVEAFIRLAPSNYRLRLAIVGAGPLREPLLAMLDAAGLRERAWFAGARGDVPELLRAFDCFILPSLAEGTSCTLQEAMATGLPIIATDVGGNAALLEDGRFGRLVPSGDVAAMAEAIGSMLADVGRGADARNSVCARYSLQGMLARYRDLFRED